MQSETIEKRVQAAYFKYSTGNPAQPAGSPEFHEIGNREYVTLSNVKGLLACYRIQNNGILRKLPKPPKEIAALY